MQPDIHTRLIPLIGTPLGQSFAARMQNTAYEAAGLNLCYFYMEADDSHLKEIMDGVRYMPAIQGAAVTKPNKVKVLAYLDELDPLAQKMGACNTVVKLPDHRLKGYNTDGAGFSVSLEKEGMLRPAQNAFYCMGAGGAGRAICSVLAYEGAQKIYISDIREAEAQTLVQDVNRNFAPVAQYVPFGDYTPAHECACVINATGVGMGETEGMSPFPAAAMNPHTLYFDACYNPDKTRFLTDAETVGAKILNGLGMSLYQGVVQIKLWTGTEAPVEVMRQELKRILKEKSWETAHKNSRIFAEEPEGGKP